ATGFLVRLVTQQDVKARDLRDNKPAPGQPDYLVEATLVNDPGQHWVCPNQGQRGVCLKVTSTKDRNIKVDFVSGPVGEKDADDKKLNAFYEQAAAKLSDLLNQMRFPTESSATTEEAVRQKALELIRDHKPESAIPLLERL